MIVPFKVKGSIFVGLFSPAHVIRVLDKMVEMLSFNSYTVGGVGEEIEQGLARGKRYG